YWLAGKYRERRAASATVDRGQLLHPCGLHRRRVRANAHRWPPPGNELGRDRVGSLHRSHDAAPRACQAQGWTEAELVCHGERGGAEHDLRLSVCGAALRLARERGSRLVVGGPGRGAHHRGGRSPRRPGELAVRRLLRRLLTT